MSVQTIKASQRAGHIGIVHLGLGAFHRAHQAVYLERYRCRTGDDQWGVSSANLRRGASLVDSLIDAGFRYHVAEYRDSDNVTVREIGAIEESLFTGQGADGQWGRDLAALLDRLANVETRIVTLTVTEKGYFLNPASGELLQSDPMIQADIAAPQTPRTAPGILVEALRRRRAAGTPPFTVLCCDNMPDNGERTRQAVAQLAQVQEAALADWILEHVAFPSSMVDRIVPAMTEQDFAALKTLGVEDANAVVCEAFSQWVVEDHFPEGRPVWDTEGVTMVADVAPFETMKLRMLNGSHSLLAYLGSLAEIETVFDAVSEESFQALLSRYMNEEAAPTLETPAEIDLNAYADSLLARFANDSLRHKLQQIAMDGSQKLPQRWLQVAEINLSASRDTACVALGLAGWIRYTAGTTLAGRAFRVDDPMAERLTALHHRHGDDAAALVDAFFGLEAVMPDTVAQSERFKQQVLDAYRALTERGVGPAIAELATQSAR
ncbi:mannitol dehydrogenase family protein [Halomonas sp. PAMB 3264]|uniref:mannitol dehydrogenase family protein n=1 Tax=Halomonas sp. PAMB 3264 TaxID=3075222 RepID=UPI00289E360A|nr:mannitol dehydrogenase family protein [Halomonas sp. PAMB 3264]WNL43553.1 mannitol dehydrogenase family protein [Halomonas sp. PAMB 3264]